MVSEQIALLLASFQNSRPGTPKAFSRMMIEELYAASPNAIVLESACRHIRRTEENWPPSIAKLLKTIEKESSAWCDRWCDEYDPDTIRQDLEKAIAKAEAKIAPAEAKLAEREAKARADEERRRLYREAYECIPVDEQRAYERETRAYHAGLAGEQIPGLELKANGSG